MMSSRHIRATKIKHASPPPPSAGWLLSFGLKTVVTHEQSSQTKTCTLCKSQRDSTYSKYQHTGAWCFHMRCILGECVWVVYSSTVCPLWHTDAFSGFVRAFVMSFPPAASVPSSTNVISNNTAQLLKTTPTDKSLSFSAVWCPAVDQLALWRKENEATGWEDLIIGLGSYYLQWGCFGLQANLQTGHKTPDQPLMNTTKCAVQTPCLMFHPLKSHSTLLGLFLLLWEDINPRVTDKNGLMLTFKVICSPWRHQAFIVRALKLGNSCSSR